MLLPLHSSFLHFYSSLLFFDFSLRFPRSLTILDKTKCNIPFNHMFFSLYDSCLISSCTPSILINLTDGRIPWENSADVLLLNRQRSLRWDLQVRMRCTCLHWCDVISCHAMWCDVLCTAPQLFSRAVHHIHHIGFGPSSPVYLSTGPLILHTAHIKPFTQHHTQHCTALHCTALYFRNQLAKRLLNQRSASDEMERLMIGKLKLRCDYR